MLNKEGLEILFGENHFVAVVGSQDSVIRTLEMLGMRAYWKPKLWAGLWKSEDATFKLPRFHYSPVITIAFASPVAKANPEVPVLIPARHLSLAVLAVCGLHQTPMEVVELCFHGHNGAIWLGRRQPATVAELQERMFIWLGKYAIGVRTHWTTGSEVPDTTEQQKCEDLAAALVKAVTDGTLFRTDKPAEEVAIYKHLRGFVIKMEKHIVLSEQLEALQTFQALAHQISMTKYRIYRFPRGEEQFSEAFVNRLKKIYAYAC